MASSPSVERIELLSATHDAYDGVSVDMKDPMDSNVFATLLKASISQWRQQVDIFINLLPLRRV